MTITIKNFQFKLTGVQNQLTSAKTKQNVKKRIADIVYLESPPSDSIKLEYVGSKPLSPVSSITIADRSNRMYPNVKNNNKQEFFGYTNSSAVPVQNKNFIVTQEFLSNSSNDIPLYYKCELPNNTIIETIKIYDSNFKKIDEDQYKIVIDYVYNNSTGIPTSNIDKINIFNSFESYYNNATGEYLVYYIQYIKVENSIETITTTLLNNKLAYPESTFNDFWELTPGYLKPWIRAYTFSSGIDEINDYVISLPTSSKYAIKYIESNRIRIIPPSDLSKEGPWFPRIFNGGFVYGYYKNISKYEIPEFKNQSFNPYEPYKLAAYVDAIKIADDLIKLPNENIESSSLFSKLYLYIKENNIIKYAITNNPLYVNEPVLDANNNYIVDSNGNILLWRSDILLGIDHLSGIVQVGIEILDKYNIKAVYSYRDNYYTISSIILNPLFNTEIHENIYSLYIVPKNIKNANSGSNQQLSSVHWIKISKSGIITESSQTSNTNNKNLNIQAQLSNFMGIELNGAIGLHYSWKATTTVSCYPDPFITLDINLEIPVVSTISFPKTGWIRALDTSGLYRYFKYISKTDTSFILSPNGNTEIPTPGIYTILDNATIELVNFIDEYTNLSDRDGDLEKERYELNYLGLYPSVFSQYFILGELSISNQQQINSLARIDVRENGGGIIKDKYKEAKSLNPRVQWLNDNNNFDGQLYPGNAVNIVKLPETLKNRFTLDQIRSIVLENSPAGIWPIIRFYGYRPKILSITPLTDSALVEWEKAGEEFLYDIWYSVSKDGQFIKANTVRLLDGTQSTNTFLVTGLNSNKPYIIRITMQDKYYQWWYSYSSPTSVGGGLGLTESPPVPVGNTTNFQFNIGA